MIVISGSQADAQGLIKAGDVALNAPGTEHEVFSEEGCLVLLVSEDLDELLDLSDRLLVMSEGRVVLETTAAAADRTAIGRAMAGH